MLCAIDEFTRERIAIRVARKLESTDVIEALANLFVLPPLMPYKQLFPHCGLCHQDRRVSLDIARSFAPDPHLEMTRSIWVSETSSGCTRFPSRM
jgi:hypothetical protein